jgi:GABA(A) receptor-associated protein
MASIIDYKKTSFTDDEISIIKREVEIVRHKYPHYIPIVVRSKDGLQLSKSKFLVTGDVTVGEFIYILRKKLEALDSSQGLFLFINNQLPPSEMEMSLLYASEKDPQTGMLFITVCKENVFG